MSKWCGDENCLQCTDKEPDPYVHLPREDYQAIRDERDRYRKALEEKDSLIETLQAQLRQVEGERDRAEGALIRAGFRKDCDIAACNCGPQWGHGGHASQRLREIADALPYQNGGVLLERIESLVREHTTLRQLVAQLPVYKDVSIIHRVDENDFETWKVWVDHNPLAECDTEGEASAIKGLLTYRATLATQDAPQPTEEAR